ncbi:PAS domain S-box-containing protein/diguanylate cyclase (GGDEF)-like protein [Prauserella shujinwangii]|uniref:PAS domain S-box-containing protein/diguanylate cyclase (GGDEF)-like protein n=1 Tax=Prauserella shujinwangii TaxID=1453103 RepID=A0A2T0LN74_9PSEU|nr:EAL domain-containing protein [Prauserella shujinwangii]PRX44609.1 PAS domain S-box-containing protein/diguanylate cyclase (GGDEF)-like protein [Prauserella shujinwangii]
MEAHDYSGLLLGRDLRQGLAVDLALSVDSAVLWSVDFTDGSVTWTPGLADIFGLSDYAERSITEVLLDLIEPMALAARSAPVWEDFDLEQRHETPEGDTRWIRFRARSFGVTGASGAGGLLGIAADVSERHADRQALADLADRYRLLVELSPDAICVHEAGRIVYANPAAVRFSASGTAEAMLGRPITDFVDPYSVPDMLRRIESLTGPGSTSEPTEVLLKRADGDTMVVESVSVRTTWEGRPAFQVIMRDVTAQKAAEAALHYQAALVSHVSDAIIATTADGVVTSWNPAAESVYGHAAADALGRDVAGLVGAPLDPGGIVDAGGVVQATHRRADGTPLAIRVSAAEMNAGYVLVCADETARREAEQRFSTVVTALDEGVVVVGRDGRVESANPAATRILGLPAEQMVGRSPTRFPLYDESGARVPKEDYPSARTLRTGQPNNGRVLRAERPDGRSVWLSMSCRPLDPEAREPSAVVTSFTDITERRAIGEQLAHDATHDPLTGLANRTLVLERLTAALRTPGRVDTACVLFIDLDKFKVINDSLGHSVGDKVLRIAARRLRHSVRSTEVVGRLGGDEFAVITLGAGEPAEIHALIHHLREALTEPISVDGRHLRIDASIGVVTARPGDRRSAEDLIRDADVAMYQAKTRGRGRYEFFDVELRERVQRQLRLEQDLRAAVPDGQLWLAYQPIVDVGTDRPVSVEALLRWTHPVHGVVPPAEFIPLAEESDLINIIGDHMLRTATQEVAELRARHGTDLRLAVNLSARQLDDAALVPAVHDALRAAGLPPDALCLEITESALMREPQTAAEVLSALRGLGVRLAIDDFGTGYSSLAQLRRLPLDTLKVDRSFVFGLGEPEERAKDAEAIIASIVAMAHAVGLTVIAEGAENERHARILRKLECDQAQGYHFGKPVPAANLFRDGQ